MCRITRKLGAASLILASLSPVFPVFAAPPPAVQPADMALPEADQLAAGRTEHAYGTDPLQKLTYWRASASTPAPLIVFVHGGGWMRGDKRTATGRQKVEHLKDQGYAFASVNYRLVPNATVEQQAADVAASVAWLRSNAGRLGIDASRIVLMGHSAGAHLVALVGTDPQYLAAVGLSLSDLRGVITLDGACYDVPRQVAGAGRLMRDTYAAAFGTDPTRQRALSPTFHAAAPNAPAFLILHIDRPDGKAQSEALAAALAQAGTAVDIQDVGGQGMRGHMEINRAMGSAEFPATAMVDSWLRKVNR